MPSTVYVEKTSRRREFAAAVLERSARDLLVRAPKKVLVKPNIVSHEPYPTTTHPEVLDAVLQFLEKFDCQMVVGDGPALDAGNPARIVQEHPLRQTCAAHGLELLNLHAFGFTRVKTERGFTLHVSAIALECDYIISLPVLKPHPNCSLTGALKNQFGLFPNRDRLLMHARILKDLHRSIAEVNTIARPHLTIMDAVQTYLSANEMRHGGQPADLGYMLAGTDPVALDCHGLKLLGTIEPMLADKGPEDVAHIAWALRVGVGSAEYRLEEGLLR
ncbi:MAG: DUF362 domain-containing protein [Chloroflexota bacterium]